MTIRLKRTPREWDESCDRCHGTGTVHRREVFSLWTPDEYDYVEPIADAPENAYVCTVAGGASIFESCKEALDIARQVRRPVAFKFNGTLAVVRVDSDPIAVAKEWWERAYGRTYEQTMENR